MSFGKLPDIEFISQLLTCDPETGKLFWLPRSPNMFSAGNSSSEIRCKNWNDRYSGREAFTAINRQGYKTGSILNKLYKAHRVVWALHYSEDADRQIDHINGDRIDNRIVNLRLATNQENQMNRTKGVGIYSKHKGVTWDKGRGLWVAKIGINGKTLNLGRFSSECAAKDAYGRAANELFGEFARSV